jgi:catechol 2,3-dioxygenase-like lactoylglutathione lyase family enzyme
MEVDLFAGVAVSDFDSAVAWFERLLGEPATFKANDSDWVWDLAEHRSIYVQRRPERAGYSMVTIFLDDLDDLDGFVESAAVRGIHPETQEKYGNGVRKVIYLDPEGNEIGFGGAPVEDGPDGP